MDCTNIDDDMELFKEICLESDSDEEVITFKSSEFIRRTLPRPRPHPPPEPPSKYMENFGDFEKYIQEKCNKLLKIVDRSTFHRIKRPIIIFFNHFQELFYHHSKWLDIFHRIALKFADRIEFIAGDQLDIDLIHPNVNPLNFFSYFIRPQDEDPTVFAIDENKQIFEYFNIHKTEENLCELCENLLNGSLYASQPIPDKQEHLVRIAVHLNYNVLVANSTKDTLLIVGLGDYQPHEENEPDYEQVAEELKDTNIQLVYIDGDKNYIPFEFYANCYPTLIFISHTDKRDFNHYDRVPRDTENVL